MEDRKYYSIGDVLSLLRSEYPDITISKIRFLESQGLLDPERTPSGYRKFYQGDVDRLRWILQEQRENFLPLKVIKRRLEKRVDGIEPPASAAARSAARSPAPAGEDGRFAGDSPEPKMKVAAGAATSAAVSVGAPVAQRRPVAVAAPAASGARSTQAAAGVSLAQGAASGGIGDGARSNERAAARAAASSPAGSAGGAAGSPPPPPRGGREAEHPAEAAGREGAAGGTSPPAAPEVRKTARSRARRKAVPDAADLASGASLGLDDLAAASGLDPDEIAELEGYGLVASRQVAGMTTYDEEALAVVRLAAAFRRYGIEARHLRLYKNAAEREAGFVGQIVTPLLRQRNPEAREKALTAIDDLLRLGDGLRQALLRHALADLTRR